MKKGDFIVPQVEPSSTEEFKDSRMLIVDDSPTTCRVFRKRLESFGASVIEAENGKVALRTIEEEIDSLDMIFCDIEMPEVNGFELCYRLHQSEWYDGTPIVMVSTRSDAKDVIRSLKLGAEDYVPKPFDQDLLVKVIRRVMDNGRA